ncbi:hypothetical protein KDA11_05650 [Candidatus Saccharibacteria bacterium]|nr:hypothetical protein [Candidatus Saccharibacteria bacterium]
MYSGTTLTIKSGRVMGAHQKIDRAARKNLRILGVKNASFPTSKQILHFEGKNGPDGIKRKSPAVNEPWHYFNPFDDQDTSLIVLINNHYNLLTIALKDREIERAAFESAWLAHALVDGLTPAHHYPYEEKLNELRGGEGIETRTSIKEKLVLPGETRTQQVKNNWKMWGPKGLMTTHGMFEFGVAAIIAPLNFPSSLPSKDDIARMQQIGVGEYFKQTAREIAVLDIYQRFYKRGWTTKLSIDIRNKLTPTIIKTVSLAWYCALLEARKR